MRILLFILVYAIGVATGYLCFERRDVRDLQAACAEPLSKAYWYRHSETTEYVIYKCGALREGD